MIKREAHLFNTQVALEEHLDQMEDNETLAQYTVYERRIQACEQAIHRHNVSLEYEMANLYMQRREDLIEEYNEEQRKLTIKLDKLQKSL